MITSKQFDIALKIITDYKNQLDNKFELEDKSEPYSINIQKSIKITLFKTLRNYYHDEYNIDLHWDDLKAMDVKLLRDINFIKLMRYRGFGKIGSYKFRKILNEYLILE